MSSRAGRRTSARHRFGIGREEAAHRLNPPLKLCNLESFLNLPSPSSQRVGSNAPAKGPQTAGSRAVVQSDQAMCCDEGEGQNGVSENAGGTPGTELDGRLLPRSSGRSLRADSRQYSKPLSASALRTDMIVTPRRPVVLRVRWSARPRAR